MKKEKIFLKTSFLSGILASCFGFCMAGMTGLSRGMYPMAVFVMIILIGLLLMGIAVRGAPDEKSPRISWKEIVMVLFLFINPLMAGILGYSLLVTAGAFAVFTLGLKIITPSGILF